MASGIPLGLSLGIDFARLDSDLSRVADKIEKVGSSTLLKVGTLSGLAGKGDAVTEQMAGQMSQIGIALSQGMASGIRASSAALLSFGARINAVLDRMSNAMIEMFNRLDVAMKGHRWTNLLTGLSNSLGNFASGGKALTPLEKAMGGAFGGIAKKASAVFNAMSMNLGETMTKAMEKAGGSMSKEMANAAKMIARIMISSLGSIEAAIKRLSTTISTTMLFAIESIAHKMKDLRVSTEATAGSIKGVGAARPYVRQPTPPKKANPIIDVDVRIKPPSAAAMERLAKSVNMKMFSDKELFTPQKSKPQKMDFSGAMPKPQMFQEFKSILKDAYGWLTKMPDKMGEMNERWKKAVATGNLFALSIDNIGRFFEKIYVAASTVVSVVARVGAGLAAMGLAAVAAVGKTISFFSTMGSIGKHSFRDLQESHGMFFGSVLGGIKVLNMLYRGLVDLVTLRAFRRVGDDAKQFGGAVQTATGFMGKLTSSVGRLGVEMAAAFGVVGVVYKVVQFFQKGVKSAADLNAEVARSKVVFGESFGEVEAQVEKNAKAFKVSKAAQMELTSSFGSMAQGAGVSEAKSADLATELNSLAIDMTGLGVTFNEAAEAMKTGLSGRAVSLKQFSVNIDDNTTKAFAWKTGLAAAGQELTMQQTLMARAGQMMRGLSYAQGALTAGANQASVQFQRAGGGMGLFAEKIGEILLPSVQSATKGFNALLGGVLNMVDAAGPSIQSWSASASGVIDTFIEKTAEFGPTILANLTWAWQEAKKGPLGFVIEGTEAIINFAKAIPEAIGIAVRNAGTLWEIAKLRVGDFVNNAIAYIQTIPANFGIIFPWILNNWRTLLVDLGEALKTIGGNLLENAINLGKAVWEALKGGEFKFEWTPLLDGFKATTEKLPELLKPAIISSQAEIDKLYEKIGKDELNRLKPKPGSEAGLMGKKAPILPEDKAKEYKLGGALESGSKEAFSAISRGMSGRSSTTDAVKQGVTVQKDILRVQKEHLETTKKQKPQLIEVK